MTILFKNYDQTGKQDRFNNFLETEQAIGEIMEASEEEIKAQAEELKRYKLEQEKRPNN